MKYAIKLTCPGIDEPGYLSRDKALRHFTWLPAEYALFSSAAKAQEVADEVRPYLSTPEDVVEVVERPQSVMDKVIFAQVG